MTALSPAAQAVLDAAYSELDYVPQRHVRWCAAAALRAAANAVTSEPPDSKPGTSPMLKAIRWERRTTREQLLAMATELEKAT